MNAEGQALATNFKAYASRRMAQSLAEIEKCVAQLSEEQMQHRGGEHENSVVNLLVHLEGNIRQWVLHGVAEQPDVRRRDEEFALTIAVSGQEALARLAATTAEARAAIEGVSAERLLVVVDPQPNGIVRHATVLEAIAKVFGHLEHHAGQIILLTKQFTRRDLDLSIPRKR